ncbi:MAG: glycosyltransferase family 4 protein [Gemmatimonadaceae bacterium]|jgi:glycosyltransferase involved in cell wall biosynthesis
MSAIPHACHSAPRLRVLVVQPSLQPPGGGNAVAAWILQALAGAHDITVCSWRPVALESVNAYYGTTLRHEDATWLPMPAVLRLLEGVPLPVVLLKSSLLFRRAKKLVGDFDVVICGHNETDFGRRTLQYIHYPSRLRPRPHADLRWYHAWTGALAAYYALCDWVADFHAERVVEATTVTNSTWIAGRMVQLYGKEARPRVVPPPVEMAPSPLAWDDREDGFVCIGRIAPEKELERVIGILARVRQTRPEIRLHIIGSRGPQWYVRRVERLAREAGDWVYLHFDVSRSDLVGLIHQNRYAIHGMSEEHFGIAPAEALLGGSIVFVPDGGGQVDIVGPEYRLRFASDEEAVDKIVAVLGSERDQATLRAFLRDRGALFTRARFEVAIRGLVDEVFSGRQ